MSKRLLDSNELPWTIPLPPWAPPRQRTLRQLRQIARRQLRSQLVARQGWGPTFIQAMVWPALSLLKAGLATREHPGSFPAKIRQFFAYVRLQWIHNIRISDQEDHLLTLPHRRTTIGGYMTCREHQALIDLISQRRRGYPSIETKDGIARFCRDYHLPAPSVLTQKDGTGIQFHADWPRQDLILKPADMGQGRGIEILTYRRDTNSWTGVNDVSVTPETILAYADCRLERHPWVLQAVLKNHTDWQSFTNGALATTRVITGSRPNQKPVLIGAYLRMPRKGAIVDNLCAGSIGAHVDISTGHLSVGQAYDDYYTEFTTHPDTGAEFVGTVLPHYQEIFQLALEAHGQAGDWTSLGWDIALTESGPQIIETNIHWAIIPGIPISKSAYLEIAQSSLSDEFHQDLP